MPPPQTPLPRIITYYQTTHDAAGNHISVLPLITQPGIALTHLIVAAIHINDEGPAHLTLNDHPPSDPRFATLWAELRVLQASGVRVLGMLGGAAQGSYARLDGPGPTDFERHYAPLRDLVRARGLDGLDLDVEEPTSLGGVVRLVDRLRADFGPQFIITMAPVAAALLHGGRHNLSGFDYGELEALRGSEIAWYNAQFYCGWGDCSSPLMYEMILLRGWPAEKVVVGLVTNPRNGSGWVPWNVLGNVVPLLIGRNPRFGGVMGWEYFNSLPGGEARPWEWAQAMTALLRGNRVVKEDGGPNVGDLIQKDREGYAVVQEADPDGDGSGARETPTPATFEYFSDESEAADL